MITSIFLLLILLVFLPLFSSSQNNFIKYFQQKVKLSENIASYYNQMINKAAKRIKYDLETLKKIENPSVDADPIENNLFVWKARIKGLQGSIWEKGTFHLSIIFPQDFPMSPPHITFLTKMYHPNIYKDGSICLDILTKEKWQPNYTILNVLEALQILLQHPNFDSAANDQPIYDKDNYFQKAIACIQKYARQ